MKRIIIASLALLVYFVPAKAQVLSGNVSTNGSSSNAIFTAVPFLTIAPDARSGAMGDVGVALSPSVFDTHWNPSKLAFLDDTNRVSISYSPWLRKIAPDANLAHLNFARKLNDRTSVGFSFNYFNLGEVKVYDINEVPLGTYQPNEFAVDLSIARKFGDNFSLGLTARYVNSAIVTSDVTVSGTGGHPGNALAADVSMFYTKPMTQFGKEAKLNFGVNISNLGTKLGYYTNGQKYFLPANFRIGVADEFKIDDLSKLTLAFDLNKLLAPTPPLRDASGKIISGRDDNRSVTSGILGSFSDAPGGFSEEIKEIAYSTGVEYMYKEQFALRAGYFYENPSKGDRRYLTLGGGYKYKELNLDFSYLIASNSDISPLGNTLRFTLGYSFGAKK